MASTLAFRLSRAVQSTISPPIPRAYKWASAYVPTASRPLLDMSQGVPGIPPPESLLKALAAASSAPSSCGYCPADGEIAMRRALAQEMKTVYGKSADITHEDVCLTAGCNMAFVAAVMTIADPGDEVIVPVPWYFNHQMSLNLLGVKAVPLPTLPEDGFMPSPERCASLITPRTKAITLVTPNNPTGAVYSPSLIASFASLARASNIALIMDETYRDFILSGPPHHLFSPSALGPGYPTAPWSWRNHLIHLFSFSKSYCIPGHRLGAIAASPSLISQTKTVLDCLQICAPRPPQLALHPILPSLRPFIRDTAHALEARHALFRASLPKRWRIGAQGAYFAFVRHPWRGVDAMDVSRRLAREKGVVTLPAGFFSDEGDAGAGVRKVEGEDRWIRFSVANVDDEKVRRVCERLAECEHEFGWELEKLEGDESA